MEAVQQRIGPIFACLMLLIAAAAARTLYIDLVRGGALRSEARSEHLRYETVIPPRGTISDDEGLPLAISQPAQEISADPLLIRQAPAVARRIAPLLGETPTAVASKLEQPGGYVVLSRALPERQAEKLLELRINGIEGRQVMRREYPRGTLAAQVLGFTGSEGAGLAGMEYLDNALLSGHAGRRRVVTAISGQPASISEPDPARAGESMSLTLDANIQARAERVLAAVGRAFAPRDATAIVMEPRSGALLAVANWPEVNDNDAATYSQAELEDRADGFTYEPGSTFKIVAVSSALQTGLIGPSSTFNVPDQIEVGERVIHDDTEHPEEMLSAAQILARSSNVGAIEISKLEGAPRFNEWVHRFGFGAPTGVDLAGEQQGFTLPLAQYSGSSMGNLPIGQGELVTPMQMAAAYAAIANGGILRAPHIVREVGGRPVRSPKGRRIISESTAAEVREMLKGVLAPGGTASEVAIPGYELAGKTGTASKVDPTTHEYSNTAFVASFVGFAPASDPRLLCAVVVDEPRAGSIYGGAVAAPAFGQIMSFALPYLGVAPE